MHDNLMLNDTLLREKLENLCKAMLETDRIREYDDQVKNFMQNEKSRTKFDSVADFEEQLHEKEHNGEEITESDINKLEELQQVMMEDEQCRTFLEVQDAIQEMMLTVEQYLATALELGRIPTKEEVSERLTELAEDGII